MHVDETHAVFNQTPPLSDYNLYDSRPALAEALALNAPGLKTPELKALGQLLGSPEMQQHARLANLHPPVLHTHDPTGHRVDEVEFHPSYHVLLGAAIAAGLHGRPWAGKQPYAHLRRAAGFTLFNELEASVMCPVSMTYAAIPALRDNAAIYRVLGPLLTSLDYSPQRWPLLQKSGLTMGMGMTEKQGGSDVQANTTQARRVGQDDWGQRYQIRGHKWFMSAPMSDAFLVLAQAPGGLSCFFLPRVLPDGQCNDLRIQRLKDKLGNRGNASAEVEFGAATAWLVGAEGQGTQQILRMGVMTRLDCALGSAGLMHQAVLQAVHHCQHRKAFGKYLIEQPLMRNVLADLALEAEGATALALRLARTWDHAENAREAQLARVLTPVTKFWVCKRAALLAQEAMECLGGNGYIEDDGRNPMARLYREAPVNSIWEGSGNIMALDLLRALREPAVQDALLTELSRARGSFAALDRRLDELPQRMADCADPQHARRLAVEIALLEQAALMVQSAPPALAATFCQSRLAPGWGMVPGLLQAPDAELELMLQRCSPR